MIFMYIFEGLRKSPQNKTTQLIRPNPFSNHFLPCFFLILPTHFFFTMTYMTLNQVISTFLLI